MTLISQYGVHIIMKGREGRKLLVEKQMHVDWKHWLMLPQMLQFVCEHFQSTFIY